MKTLADTGRFVIQEGNYDDFGHYRFALDERVVSKHTGERNLLLNLGWFKTRAEADNEISRRLQDAGAL